MTKQQLREAIRRIIKQELSEAAPAPTKPTPTKEPMVAPGKPAEKKPRRPLGNPNVKPQPKATKATMKEAEMLKQVIKRFKSKKSLGEEINLTPGISKFDTAEQLVKSIKDRLIAASQLRDWNLVDEVASDVFNFTKNKM